MELLNQIDGYIWGAPLIILLLGTGLYLTIRLRGLQFMHLARGFRIAFGGETEKTAEGDISHFQSLMTALSATIGTGNIAGVATAIAIGGPGAIFWMWMTGLVGMVTKYAEALLAVKYRYQDEKGEMVGGPMVYIAAIGDHAGWRHLATAFALFAIVASFGIGNMVQSNSVADALNSAFGVPEMTTGITLALLTSFVILGGITWIGRVTSVLTPVMIFFYCTAALGAIVTHLDAVPGAFALIFSNAFTGTAATGGFAGAAIMVAIRMGVARGIFSNESGLGSAAIVAAAAKTKEPVAQALVSMTQTFIDTLIVCTMTALVILISGAWTTGQNGAELTTTAFAATTPGGLGAMAVSVSLAFFAYSTLLGWSYYGEKASETLFGAGAVKPYRILFSLLVAVGASLKLDAVWTFSDIANGLMAFPNLVALLLLAPVVVAESKRFFAKG